MQVWGCSKWEHLDEVWFTDLFQIQFTLTQLPHPPGSSSVFLPLFISPSISLAYTLVYFLSLFSDAIAISPFLISYFAQRKMSSPYNSSCSLSQSDVPICSFYCECQRGGGNHFLPTHRCVGKSHWNEWDTSYINLERVAAQDITQRLPESLEINLGSSYMTLPTYSKSSFFIFIFKLPFSKSHNPLLFPKLRYSSSIPKDGISYLEKHSAYSLPFGLIFFSVLS